MWRYTMLCLVLAGCTEDVVITAASSGVCYHSTTSFNVLCALNVAVEIKIPIATGDVTVVTTSLLMNTYHVDQVEFSGTITTSRIAKNGPLCGTYDDRLEGNGCPLIHNGVACVGRQTTIAVFDGGPMGALIGEAEVDVPMSCQ